MQQTIIKSLSKGQITIPASFRQALGIKGKTFFQAEIKDEGVFLKPLQTDWEEKYIRDFTDEEINEWLEEDKLNRRTLKKLKYYLK